MRHYQVHMWQFEAKYYTLSCPYVVVRGKYDDYQAHMWLSEPYPYVVVRGQI